MSELNTKTLNELTTVDSLLNTDTVLIESGGRMKKVSPSAIGGGGGGNVVIANGQLQGEVEPNVPYSVNLDKTYNEIVSAEYSVLHIYGTDNYGEEGFYLPLSGKSGNSETNEYALMYLLSVGADGLYHATLTNSGCTFTYVNTSS